jgi:hypothetical protein
MSVAVQASCNQDLLAFLVMQESRFKAYWYHLIEDLQGHVNQAVAKDTCLKLPDNCVQLVQETIKTGVSLSKVVTLSLKVHVDRYNSIIKNVATGYVASMLDRSMPVM